MQLTPFDLYIKTLFASKRNQIYSEASSTRFSAINLLYLCLPMKLLTDLKKITDILDNYQTSRGTQFNLTLFDLYIKTLYTSKRNQIYSEASSTRFSAINLLYLCLPMKLLTDLHQIADISGPPLLAEHNAIDTFRFIYQNTFRI